MPMQTSNRARELERLYKSRQAPSANSPPTLQPPPPSDNVSSSSYSSSGMSSSKKPRPLSFIPGPQGEVLNTHAVPTFPDSSSHRFRNPFEDRSSSANTRYAPVQSLEPPHEAYRHHQHQADSRNGNGTNTMSNSSGSSSDPPSTQSFPLNDIDYESNPMAVAQELSNLQAIRRMSMDVNTMDPDLPSFNPAYGGAPSLAPSHDSDEEDPSRLFWVPARLHPELAPKEFKTFIQEKVRTIKRSSLSEQALMAESAGSLRRRKSMLSRQIDSASGYEDGSTRLRRKESQNNQGTHNMNLHDLEELVSDPTGLARRMSVDRTSMESGSDMMGPDDMPILAGKPGLQSLKRSTRTTYRKQGSLKKAGGRRQLSRPDDMGDFHHGSGASQLPETTHLQDLVEFADVHFGLTRVNTDPAPSSKNVENFSRPGRRPSSHGHGLRGPTRSATFDDSFDHRQHNDSFDQRQHNDSFDHRQHNQHSQGREDSLQPRYGANGRSNHYSQPIPEIIETPPEPRQQSYDQPAVSERHSEPLIPQRVPQDPQRTQPLPQRTTSAGSSNRPNNISLNDIASHPNLLPQSGSRTDALSVIPTYAEDNSPTPKKLDKKAKSKDDGSRKTSWNWFGSGNSEEKEREKREKEEKELAKKSKSKLQKNGDKQQQHDNARLDVLQQSIEGSQGRESTIFDRQSIHMDEDSPSGKRRPVTSEGKKDGFLSSLFGSSKRKSDRDDKTSKNKSGSSNNRGLSPDPPHGNRPLRPDVDYNWTRFSILEERAIYRMAHMKLANPRRELLSQVLLSNFMYSYLAKVQQMHPQIQIPQTAAQKQQARQERASKQREEEERKAQQAQAQQQLMMQQQQSQQSQQPMEDEFSGYQRYQESAYSNGGSEVGILDDRRQQQHQQQQQYNLPQRGQQPSQQQQQHYGVNGGNEYYEYDRNGYEGGYGSQQQQQQSQQGWYDQQGARQQQQQQQQQQSERQPHW